MQTAPHNTASSMPPQNHADSIQDQTHEFSKRSTNLQELEMPLSSEKISSSESEKTVSKPQESDCISDVPNEISHEEEEDKDKCDAEVTSTVPAKSEATVEDSSSGRERLKRHRVEVAGRVWIPDMWGQEDFLKDWIDCAAFDASLVNSSIMSARASLVEEGRRANSTRLRVENSC